MLELEINNTNQGTLNYKVVSVTGQTILRGVINGEIGKARIGVEQLMPGTYYLKLEGGGASWAIKFVKAK
jgi:hypothetical protein